MACSSERLRQGFALHLLVLLGGNTAAERSRQQCDSANAMMTNSRMAGSCKLYCKSSASNVVQYARDNIVAPARPGNSGDGDVDGPAAAFDGCRRPEFRTHLMTAAGRTSDTLCAFLGHSHEDRSFLHQSQRCAWCSSVMLTQSVRS